MLGWDVTVTCPLAESYIDRSALEAGAAVEMVATRKEQKFYVDLGARYSFEPIAVETLGVLTHQLVTSSTILEGGSLKTRARLERPASCTKVFRFWYSASMLSFCMTVCRLQTAQTVDRTQFCIFYAIFATPSGLICTERQRIIIVHGTSVARNLSQHLTD